MHSKENRPTASWIRIHLARNPHPAVVLGKTITTCLATTNTATTWIEPQSTPIPRKRPRSPHQCPLPPPSRQHRLTTTRSRTLKLNGMSTKSSQKQKLRPIISTFCTFRFVLCCSFSVTYRWQTWRPAPSHAAKCSSALLLSRSGRTLSFITFSGITRPTSCT
ncbi:hypothetical protein BCR44DRAFT_184446 [Catenaria anguillulae PL171]|uniref:Uncharacterized protein n=1 Tax=Catenaria anguillulae PL171 TaxID=765915 RepID=A0A1Y2H438_9FUNG|nr:hypothetical protein BCR44DRAFT_184446 [Catenaria anguillulae PL171]